MSVMMAVMMVILAPRAVASAERVEQVLDTAPSIADPPEPVTPARATGLVEFRNVTFGYPGSEQPVLRDLSFTFRPGKTSAIIGGTGSGKTTLLNLIPRFADATGGSVLVNGVDVRDQEREELWAGIGLVPQAAFLFSGTVASNLRFGRPEATEAELWHALAIGMIRAARMGRPGPGQPPERSKDLRGTVRRLLARLRPERVWLVIVLVFGVISVALLVTGPKILGAATNVLFDGVVGKQLPAGVTKEQAVALLRAHGQGQLADMISGMNIIPGAGVDVTQLGRVLGLAALVYLLGAAFGWGQGLIMAGITQRTMYGLRRRSRRSWLGCRCGTSTATRTATSSAGSSPTGCPPSQRGHDHRDGRRAHHRAGQPSRPAPPPRRLLLPLQQPVHRGLRRGKLMARGIRPSGA